MKHHMHVHAISIFERRQKTKSYLIAIAMDLIFIVAIHSQVNIALQNFETSGSNYNYTNTNGSLQIGNSSSSDRPASASFYVSSNTGFRTTNQLATLTFENITGLGPFHAKKLSLRLAAFSINSSSNGMDGSDKVSISISLDGGSLFSNELMVKGNSNAYWHYSTGTGMAIVPYDGNNISTEFFPSGGGNRTTDGYSILTVSLPDSCIQVKLKIVIINDSNNEAWLIDEALLKGCLTSQAICPIDSTVCISSGLITLIGGYPVGGTYSGAGVSNGMFDPSIAGIGVHTISYLYTDANGCKSTCTFQISVISSGIYNVQTDLYYCSMSEAIAAISDGEELEIPAGIYVGSCLEISKNIKLTSLVSGIEIPCLKMLGSGKFLIMGGDLIINQLTLTNGKIQTNGHKLACECIIGGNSNSYIITN